MSEGYIRLLGATVLLVLFACEQSVTSIEAPTLDQDQPPLVVAAASGAGVSGSCIAPAAPLVSWWSGDGHFDDIAEPLAEANGITIISDAAGKPTPIANGGTVTFEDGIDGQGFRFTARDGQPDQFLEIPNAPDLTPAEFTVDLWAKRLGDGQNANSGSMLIEKALEDGYPVGETLSYYITWRADGKILADVNFGGSFAGPIVSASNFSNDEWEHIALTVEGSTATLYINGAAEGTLTGPPGSAVLYGGGSVVIGSNFEWARRPSSGGYHLGFDGLIDEIDLFGRALSLEEIQAISGAGSKCKGGEPENQAPVVDAGQDVEIDEGDTFTSAGSFTDPDLDSWTATVDYGDGSGVQNLDLTAMDFDLEHTYADDGTYTVAVTVDDGVSEPVSATATVVVNDVDPSVDAGDDAVIFEGETFQSSGSFTDPGADEWIATVDYGDGSGVQDLALTGKNFELSHTYASNGSGPFMVTVNVSETGPVTATARVVATYSDGGVGSSTVRVGSSTVSVTVIYPMSIHEAKVTLDRRGRVARDRFEIEGELPLSLLERLNAEDDVTIEFAGFEQLISAESFVRRNRRGKWQFRAERRTPGIQIFDLHRNGRFRIHARDLNVDLRGVDFTQPVELSITVAGDIGEASVQLDGRLRYRSRGADDRNDDEKSDKSERSEKSGKSGKSGRSG